MKSLRSALPVAGVILYTSVVSMQTLLFSRQPDFRAQITVIAAVHLVMLFVGCLAYPFFLRVMQTRRTMPPLVRLWPFLAACAVILVVRATTGPGALSLHHYLMFATTGLLFAPAHAVFYAAVPQNRQGRWLGANVFFTVASWIASLEFLLAGNPEADVFLLRQSYLYHFVTLIVAATMIVLSAALADGQNRRFPPPRTDPPGSPGERQRLKNIWLLIAVTSVFFLMNGFLGARLFPFINTMSSAGNALMNLPIALLCPVMGFLLDRNRRFWFGVIVSCCSLFIAVAPSLVGLDDNPVLFHVILALASLGQFSIMLTVPLLLAGMVRDGMWFCLVYSTAYGLRILSFIGAWTFYMADIEDDGEMILIAITTAIVFYVLASKVRLKMGGDLETEPSNERPDGQNPRAEERGSFAAVPAAKADDYGELFARHGLSPRETEVADLLIKGLSTREISEKLSISEHTVKAHVKKVLLKFEVPTRKAFMATFIAHNDHDAR